MLKSNLIVQYKQSNSYHAETVQKDKADNIQIRINSFDSVSISKALGDQPYH